MTAQQFGYLVTFEMVTAMLCYIPVAHLADKYGRRPFVLITFVFFTLFPVTLLWAHNFRWLALAFVVRGLEGIWRTGAQGAHHRRGDAGTSRADLRRVLSHPRLHGDERFVSRRVAVERESAGEFHRRGHLRRAGDGLVLVVYLPEKRQSQWHDMINAANQKFVIFEHLLLSLFPLLIFERC